MSFFGVIGRYCLSEKHVLAPRRDFVGHALHSHHRATAVVVWFVSSSMQQGWHCCLSEQLEGLAANECLIHHIACLQNIILKVFKWHLQVLVVELFCNGALFKL